MVRKEDVIRLLDEQDEKARLAFTAVIDRRLPAYDGKHSVSVPVPKGMSDKVVDRIIRDYGKGQDNGGWTVSREKGDDPRGDCWDNLVFS